MTVEMPDSADVNRIADALVARQGLERQRAVQIARQITSSGEDISTAARIWADTGDMPDVPVIGGYTPIRLSERLSPSQVFTGLAAIRENPAVAKDLLRFSPNDSPAARARQWEAQVGDALRALPALESICNQPLGPDRRSRPDFIVSVAGKPIVVEAKATPARPERLRLALDQVERYVLVFRAHGGLVVVPQAPRDPVRGYLAPVVVTDLEHLAASLDELVNTPSEGSSGPQSR